MSATRPSRSTARSMLPTRRPRLGATSAVTRPITASTTKSSSSVKPREDRPGRSGRQDPDIAVIALAAAFAVGSEGVDGHRLTIGAGHGVLVGITPGV